MTATAASERIQKRFAGLRKSARGGLVAFVMAGDPDPARSLDILKGLPGAGADLIELGMPFTDPMADGPAIQLAGQRALKAGQTLKKTLAMVEAFRADDDDTPIILMGYYNPIYRFGVERFLSEARDAGVDGLIIVDLPPEEDDELCLPTIRAGLDFIRLATPTTDDRRLPAVLKNTGGFVYYVSITGITGAEAAPQDTVRAAVDRLKRHTDLPIAVGFGIKTPEQAGAVASVADAAVVGSALVSRVAEALDDGGDPVDRVLALVSDLSGGVRNARA